MPTTATLTSSNYSSQVQNLKPIPQSNSLAESILSAPSYHTGLIKIQGPFTNRQLESIIDGIIYLKTLGLIPIIVLDDEDWHSPTTNLHLPSNPFKTALLFPLNPRQNRRDSINRQTERLTKILEERGAQTTPINLGLFKLTDHSNQDRDGPDLQIDNLNIIRSALFHHQIPIIPPIALNSSCNFVAVSADQVLKLLAKALAQFNPSKFKSNSNHSSHHSNFLNNNNNNNNNNQINLTPLRLMVINREGGIPSPARNGYPHLSINLASEFDFINQTFRWHHSHPTSLNNLTMIKSCLQYLPNESSAIIVSHRSPRSLIANLITNKPAHSPSLKHSFLLSHSRQIGLATPTLIRKGLPIKVIRQTQNINKQKLSSLLQESFQKQLNQISFFTRLEKSLRFAIIAGDYQGAVIVTNEIDQFAIEPVVYLDKFAVLPSLQGEGVVDFLWGALRDESFGLGNLDALNNNGGLSGHGTPVDLVWRSRTQNPVNRWYFERSNGFIKIGQPINSSPNGPEFSLFWCYADWGDSNPYHSDKENSSQLKKTLLDDLSIASRKIQNWSRIVKQIPSSWL
ncbi:hypothetical protein O181_061914 [Austropuccinia psidii MF-1]|uniref:Amino-acid acetyltransferase, mitochondrial n=1 Tax=Austropuccinia psidii MF-1 TaxID=1389203 RepID=A0A9Q3EJD7_9BASI|nr:hypothetical protein [Austropuccinia psidii MF-1]